MLLKDTTRINDNWTFTLGDCSDYAYAATDFDDKKWEKPLSHYQLQHGLLRPDFQTHG